MPATFRGRLTVTLSALSIGVLALASLIIYAGMHWALLRNLDEALLALARTEIASAFDEPGGFIHTHDQAPAAVELGKSLAYEKVTQIVDARGETVAHTSNLATGPRLEPKGPLVRRALGGEAVFANARRGSEDYRTLYHPLADAEGHRYAIMVAVSRRPLDLTLEAAAVVLLVALVAAGGLAAFAASRVSRRLTRPLDRIAAAARQVGEANLTARIPNVSHDGELRALVALLNDMLARIESAFATQRRFVADASHELRSPLANLRGTIEVALRRPRAVSDYQEALGVALGEIERLGRLVHGLLTLSRAGAGRLAIDRRSADLRELAERAVRMHAPRAAALDVELRLDAGTPVAVHGDPDRLREVLDNLLDNALRVAPKGSSIQVAIGQHDGRCILEVADAGPGLSAEEQAGVFEPFARGAAPGGDGAGLGLAIARAIAEAHGGHLGVRSTPGAGAVFCLELPASGSDERPCAPDEELACGPSVTGHGAPSG